MDRIDAEIWNARDVARLLALVEDEKRYYQEILTVFPVPAAIVSRDFSLQSTNREFRTRFLPHRDEEHLRRITDILHSTVVREHIVPAFESSTPVHGAEITVLDERGVAGMWLLDALPVPDIHHESPRQALVVLREAVEKDSGLAALLEQASTIIWKLDPAGGEIEFGNSAASQLLGFHTPQHWMQRVHPEDERRVAWVYEAVIESTREATVEYRIQRTGKDPLWAADHLLPVKQADGSVGQLRIVTTIQEERRNYYSEMTHTREMEAAMRLARQVAHEFNNLWMIVSGYSEVVEQRVASDPDARSGLEEIGKAARRGIETTRQLLEFGRPPASSTQAFDLHKELREWRPEVDLALFPGPAGVTASPDHLHDSLNRLIEWARSHDPSSRLTLETSRETLISDFGRGTPRGQFIVIRLGPIQGVTSGTVEHWSEPFYSDREKVSPIGLAPVYSQLRQMGAYVRLQPGAGVAAFVLHLPPGKLAEPPKPAPQQGSQSFPSTSPVPERETILVVDPEESIRGLVARILEPSGYQVHTAATAEEAQSIALSLHGSLALLITEVEIAGMRGPELAVRLRESLPSLRTLFIAGFIEDPEFMAGELPVGEGFLQKPFTIVSLSAMVRTVLDAPRN